MHANTPKNIRAKEKEQDHHQAPRQSVRVVPSPLPAEETRIYRGVLD